MVLAVHRVACRLGWAPSNSSREKTYGRLCEQVPDVLKRELHVLLINLGQQVPCPNAPPPNCLPTLVVALQQRPFTLLARCADGVRGWRGGWAQTCGAHKPKCDECVLRAQCSFLGQELGFH